MSQHEESTNNLTEKSNQDQLKDLIANFQQQAMSLGFSTLTVCVDQAGTQLDTSVHTSYFEELVLIQRYRLAFERIIQEKNN